MSLDAGVDEGPGQPGLEAKKSRLRRLLRESLARDGSQAIEVAELLERVHRARTTEDLRAIAGRLLKVIGVPKPAGTGRDRRRFARRACSLMVRILEDGSHGMHFVRNLGLGGMSLYIQAPLPLFPVLHCQLPLYDRSRVFAFTARAVWCHPDPPQIVGLEFVEIGPDVLDWIREFVGEE